MPRYSPFALGRSLAALSLFLIWLLPFCLRDHKIPVGTFWQEWTAATLLLSAACIGLLAQREPLTLRLPRALLIVVAMAGVISLQFALGMLNFSATWSVPLSYLGLAALACILGASLRSDTTQTTMWSSGIATAVIIGGVFTVYAQIAQSLGLDHVQPFISPLPAGQHPFGNTNQVNHTATYLGLALAAVVFLRASGQLNRISTGVLLLIVTSGLSLTAQRSALVYAALPLLLTLVLWRRLPGERRTALITGSIALTLFILISLLLPSLDPAEGTLTPLTKLVRKSFYNDRMNFWEHAWVMFRAHPWLGVGFDQFWPQFFAQLDTLGGEAAPNHPHNFFAVLFSETGIIGAMLVSTPLLLWLRRQRSGAITWTQWLGLSQLAMIGFHSMIEYPLWYAYFLVIAAFWFGATDSAHWTFVARKPRVLGALLAIVALPLLVNVGARYQQLRTQVWAMPHPGILGLTEFQPTASSNTLETLDGHWFFAREVLFWQPDLIGIRTEHLPQDIAQTERAMQVAPSSSLLFRLCVLRVLSGDVDAATGLLHRARQIYPERYEQMQAALPLAAKRWPTQFGPALPRLIAP